MKVSASAEEDSAVAKEAKRGLILRFHLDLLFGLLAHGIRELTHCPRFRVERAICEGWITAPNNESLVGHRPSTNLNPL